MGRWRYFNTSMRFCAPCFSGDCFAVNSCFSTGFFLAFYLHNFHSLTINALFTYFLAHSILARSIRFQLIYLDFSACHLFRQHFGAVLLLPPRMWPFVHSHCTSEYLATWAGSWPPEFHHASCNFVNPYNTDGLRQTVLFLGFTICSCLV